ncbi:hypothetical protein TWF506_010664 [Arthrobotrys conoides]|uniref:Uncharacterized protein n=1 Tax=Arthrobotrys conoides TaxID=74498 RepID=A0AAN8NFA4_9PEZI
MLCVKTYAHKLEEFKVCIPLGQAYPRQKHPSLSSSSQLSCQINYFLYCIFRYKTINTLQFHACLNIPRPSTSCPPPPSPASQERIPRRPESGSVSTIGSEMPSSRPLVTRNVPNADIIPIPSRTTQTTKPSSFLSFRTRIGRRVRVGDEKGSSDTL